MAMHMIAMQEMITMMRGWEECESLLQDCGEAVHCHSVVEVEHHLVLGQADELACALPAGEIEHNLSARQKKNIDYLK